MQKFFHYLLVDALIIIASILFVKVCKADIGIQKEINRSSITFILGEDKERDNPYYSKAREYYKLNLDNRTTPIISHCTSLLGMRNFLENYPTDNGLPWGTINIVVHSNEWKGLGVPLNEKGERIITSLLRKAIQDNTFLPLADNILDGGSTLMIYGCGLGNNSALLTELRRAFGGDDAQQPIVRASKLFIGYYTEDNDAQRFLSEYWYGYFKTGYRPANYHLQRQFEANYPTEEVDWIDALSRTQPRFAGDVYHYYFNIPISWMITFENEADFPDISDETKQLEWLKQQRELITALERIEIPFDKFRWKLKKTSHTFEDGVTEPVIKIEGKSSVLCVLRALTIENHDDSMKPLPFEPSLEDERFYTTIGNDKLLSSAYLFKK